MSEPIHLKDQTALKRLAERLSQCPEVTKYDQGEEKEAGVLAHSFGDLEESFRTFLKEQLPRLMDEHATPAERVGKIIADEFGLQNFGIIK